MKKIVLREQEARIKIKQGYDFVADSVKLSLGHFGGSAAISRSYQALEFTRDGITIAEEHGIIEGLDEIQQIGADLAKSTGKNADITARDGTTTAITLGQSISNVGFKQISSGELIKKTKSGNLVDKEIQEAKNLVITELEKLAKPIKTKEDLLNAVLVSVKDKDIAQTITDIYWEIGSDGLINVEDYYGGKIISSIEEGIAIDSGSTTAELEKPAVYTTNTPISNWEQLEAIANNAPKDKNSFLIIVPNIKDELIDKVDAARSIDGTDTYVIKAPYTGKPERMEDIACRLGVPCETWGTCDKAILTKTTTTLRGTHGDTSERVKQLKKELEESDNRFDKEQLEKRIASLSKGVGVIKVGAESEEQRILIKKNIIDGVGSGKNALIAGVIPGGGLALKMVSETLPPNILSEAILAPYKQIQENAGMPIEIDENIVDPLINTKTALSIACRQAGLMLTVRVAIADKYEEPKDFAD